MIVLNQEILINPEISHPCIHKHCRDSQHTHTFKRDGIVRHSWKPMAKSPTTTYCINSNYDGFTYYQHPMQSSQRVPQGSGISALPTVYKRSTIVHITRIHSLMTLPVLFWRRGKELFCTVSKKKSKKKKKVKPTYRPCFFLARNLKHNYFFFWPKVNNRINEIYYIPLHGSFETLSQYITK